MYKRTCVLKLRNIPRLKGVESLTEAIGIMEYGKKVALKVVINETQDVITTIASLILMNRFIVD